MNLSKYLYELASYHCKPMFEVTMTLSDRLQVINKVRREIMKYPEINISQLGLTHIKFRSNIWKQIKQVDGYYSEEDALIASIESTFAYLPKDPKYVYTIVGCHASNATYYIIKTLKTNLSYAGDHNPY
jgi:hypothetical protein